MPDSSVRAISQGYSTINVVVIINRNLLSCPIHGIDRLGTMAGENRILAQRLLEPID